MHPLKIATLIFCIFLGTSIHAQGISGRVFLKHKGPLSYATVRIFKNDTFKQETLTDFDGRYSIETLEPGKYDIIISYPGCTQIKASTKVNARRTTTENFMMQPMSHH